MPVGDETLSEHRRKKRNSAVASRVFPMARWEGVAELKHGGSAEAFGFELMGWLCRQSESEHR
uniref:Uncharacterized protein n=1 Tax=Capra hircus TaxID=9925 RepID=A0A8C2RP04_CAPHI